jgi:hypothetical protein
VDTAGILDQIVSHALSSGWFERVNQHEPKSAPGNGLSCAVWLESIGPPRSGSGLSSTSGRLVFSVRLYTSMLADPADAIDPLLMSACDALLTAYSGDFELGATVRAIDLLGMSGDPLSARAGYLAQDNKLFRVLTITLPLIVNDLWAQVA